MANYSTDICSYKEVWTLDTWVCNYIHNHYKIFGDYIKEGQTTLDLGCGTGFFPCQWLRW